MAIVKNKPDTSRSEQIVLNRSVDDKFDVLAVELVGYEPSSESLKRVAVNSDGEIQIDTTNLDTRYLKLDQTTPQTVTGGIPKLDAQISDFDNLDQFVNKRYVDSAVSSLIVDWYVLDTASGVEDYKLTTTDIADLGDTQQTISKNDITDGDFLAGWISPDGQTPTILPLGVYNLSIYAEKTGGNKDIQIYWQLVERLSDNTENVLATSSYSDIMGNSKQQYLVPLILDADRVPSSGSRIVGKVYAHVTGSGNAPSLTIYYENDSMTRWSMPTTLEVISNQFVDVSGDTMTGNLEISKTSPELRLTDTGDDEYTRIIRSGTNNTVTRYNRVEKQGAAGYGLEAHRTGNEWVTFSSANIGTILDNVISEQGTIECWFWADQYPGAWMWILGRGRGGSGHQFYVALADAGGRINVSIGNAGNWDGRNTDVIASLNTWHHIAVVWKYAGGDDFIRVYLDGTQIYNNTLGHVMTPTSTADMWFFDGGNGWEMLDGKIDEVRISKVVRYSSNFTPQVNAFSPDSDTVLLWHLEEGSGNTITDETESLSGTKDSNISWVTGHVTTNPSMVEALVWESQDGQGAGEKGLQKFGDDDGRTVLQGTNIYIGTGTGKKIGFYNATPVAQQTGVPVTAEGIHAALVNLGLITA